MFPRTVGGLVSLFIETGELDRSERLIDCTLMALTGNGMDRVPHVFDRASTLIRPIAEAGQTVQAATDTPLYRIDGGYRAGQSFTAPAEPVRAIEAYVTHGGCKGTFTMTIQPGRDADPLLTLKKTAEELGNNPWVRLELPTPPALEPGQRYVFMLSFEGSGVPVWSGLAEAGANPLAGAMAWDVATDTPHWIDHPGHVTAFAIDTGSLRHETLQQTYPIISRMDQIDGQAHVIMAWARLALTRGHTDFEDRTWPVVAKLMDRTSDWPYILGPGTSICHLGLVRNVCLEHSREGRYWDTYDILTQSFAGAALESMAAVARRRGDGVHANRWENRLTSLKSSIDKSMTRDLDGKKVYLEMRFPNAYAGIPFEGLGWVNLAPVAAQWEGLDHQVLVNTIQALRARDMNEWHGLKWLGTDWTPGVGSSSQVIGKGVGWEIDFCRKEGEYGRILEWLDFVQAVNSADIYLEAANYNAAQDKWILQDPGNGEQTTWWCWAIARLRKQAGLSAAPVKQ